MKARAQFRRSLALATVLIAARAMSQVASPMAMQTPASLAVLPAEPMATSENAPAQQHIAPLSFTDAAQAGSSQKKPADSGDAHTLHLVVGRSLFLTTAEKLRRVYVSNPAVLDAMTASPFEVVISARATGASTVVMWSTSGDATTYTVFADVEVGGLRESLAQALPGNRLEVQAEQGRIVLSGVVDSDAAAAEAARLAGVYSKDVVNSLVVDPRHLPQVKLEVRVAEIDRSKLTAFGINLFSLGKNSGSVTTGQFSPPSFQSQNGVNTAVVSDYLNLFYFNFDHGLGATIKDLQNKGVLQILAEPNLTTIHGRTARFLAGGEFPYPIVQPGGAGTVPTVTVQFRPYGVKLEFTPYVNSDGTIRLRVAPEVSALDYTNQVVIAGYALPALSTRRAETEVELRDGESFGISGILDHRTTDNLSKIPGIGDIPILGQLFRSKNLDRSTMELVVIVTPKIIDALNPATPPASSPAMAVPFLNTPAFDKQLPKN